MNKQIPPWKLILCAIIAFVFLAVFNKFFRLFLISAGINTEAFYEGILFTYVSAIVVGFSVGMIFALKLKRTLIQKERLWFIWTYGIITTSLYLLFIIMSYFEKDLTTWGILDFIIKAPAYPLFAYLFLSDRFINILFQKKT